MHQQMQKMQAMLEGFTVEDPVRQAQIKAFTESQLAPPIPEPTPTETNSAAAKSRKIGATKKTAGPKPTIGKPGKTKGQALPADATAA